MTDHLRVAAIQMRHRESVDAALDAARDLVSKAASDGARLVLLPEYFAAPDTGASGHGAATDAPRSVSVDAELHDVAGGPKLLASRARDVERFLERASRESDVALAAASLVERDGAYFNVGFLYDGGRRVGEQVKVHPMPREETWNLVPGTGFRVFEAAGIRVGILVCADVLYPEASRILALEGADVILNPVMSPYRGDDGEDPTRLARESVFVARAWDSAAFLVKAGGTMGSRRAVGRSLVAAPWGLLARYVDEWTEEVVVSDLDLAALRKFRSTQRGLVARQPNAYSRLLDL